MFPRARHIWVAAKASSYPSVLTMVPFGSLVPLGTVMPLASKLPTGHLLLEDHVRPRVTNANAWDGTAMRHFADAPMPITKSSGAMCEVRSSPIMSCRTSSSWHVYTWQAASKAVLLVSGTPQFGKRAAEPQRGPQHSLKLGGLFNQVCSP